MPSYSYKAVLANGSIVTGEDVAPSAEELALDLAGKGLLVERIRSKRPLWGGYGLSSRIKVESFMLFNHEFMALIRSGMPIPEALEVACERRDSQQFTRILKSVLEDVRSGKHFSDACARHPDAFSAHYIATLKTGEMAGDLGNVLTSYHVDLKQQVALQKQISQAMAYPAFLLITLAVILAVLFVFVMPRFISIYADFEVQLPLPTRILLAIVDDLILYAILLAGVGFGILLVFKAIKTTESGRIWIGLLKVRLPIFGNIHRVAIVAQVSRMLSTLLTAGTTITSALQSTQDALGNYAYARRVSLAAERVIEGQGLAQAFRLEQVMPDTAVKLIEVGEASGNLDEMLGEVARYYEELLQNSLARVMALLEPALMLLIGILVGGIILIMYLPIFYIAEVIK